MKLHLMNKFGLKELAAVIGIFLIFASCNNPPYPYGPPTPRPLPTTVPELIGLMEKEKDAVYPPYDVIEALGNFGPEAAAAVPLITPWLDYRADRGVTNSFAAEALAKIGPDAAPAVPDLIAGIHWMRGSDSVEPQITLGSFVIALGQIGPEAAASVPVLIDLIYADEAGFVAAWSIAQITEQDWPDADLDVEWDHGLPSFVPDSTLQKDEYGEHYLIDIEAVEWWESEGQNQVWPDLNK